MCEQFSRELLRVAVAQICQTIGYNSTQTSSLELLQDLLHRFLNEFARDLRRQVEHDNRTLACLEDVALTFSSVNININELLDYIGNVEPVPFAIDVPNFPINKQSNLNFLKPGSKEVLSRPVHVFEHLPPMLPPDPPQHYINGGESNMKSLVAYGTVSDLGTPTEDKLRTKIKTDYEEHPKLDVSMPTSLSVVPTALACKSLPLMDEHGRPTREIMSVVMTTGGFISPAIEGKLPDAGIPTLVEKFFGLDAPPPPTPPLPSEHLSESLAKLSSLKEISPSTPKKLSESFEPIEKLKKCDETGYSETDAIPKKNVFPSNIKKNLSQQVNQSLQPTVALKLLKKAKKKSSVLNFQTTETAVSDVISEKLSEKARRKRLKIFQKMMKNTQKDQFMSSGTVDTKKEGKKSKSFSNINFLSEIPHGIPHARVEKLLKKQAKQKQKLKKLLSFEYQKQQSTVNPPVQINPLDENGLSAVKPSSQLTEGSYPKVVQKHDMNQASLNVNNANSTQPPLVNICDKLASNMSSVHADTENVSPGSQNTVLPVEKNTGVQLKLSNEPDRSKLNIFKKISKGQKAPANQSVPIPKPITSNSFTGSEGQIINLPTGTTITPAPINFHPPAKLTYQAERSVAGSVVNTTLDLSTKSQPEATHKPKKRGRKPGSKNQPKVLPLNDALIHSDTMQPLLLKKQKKLKTNSTATETVIQQPTASTTSYLKIEPFERTSMPSFPETLLKPLRKERKDKQKPVDLFNTFTDVTPLKDPNKPSQAMSFGGMPITSLNMLFNNSNKEAVPPQQKTRKRSATQFNNGSQSASMIPPFLAATQTTTGFPQLPSANILSMLPFAFSPRPGLIPSPGFFPPTAGLSNFSSQMPNPSSSSAGGGQGLLGLAPTFLNFPTTSNKAQERPVPTKETPALPTTYPVDRNYCNVAPLIPPESIKPVSETTGNMSLVTMAKQYASKVSQLEPKSNETDSDNANTEPPFLGKLPESAHNLSRKAAVTSLRPINASPPRLHVSGALEKHTPTGGVDDPIEVSDDSDEVTMPLTNATMAHKPFDSIALQVPRTPQLPSPHEPTQVESPKSISSLYEHDMKLITKDGKKSKKAFKYPKKNPKIVEPESAALDVFTVNCSSGDVFSKLAGGADLIPLSGTGSAYSAKSVPPTSLTASRPLIIDGGANENSKREKSNERESLFNDVTIIPNIQKKKSKAHKKLRKLKDGDGGKVKKKKDKKDKSKNKELLEFAFGQKPLFEKLVDKEAFRRLKKEKKKQKQRSQFPTTTEQLPTDIKLQMAQLPSAFEKISDSTVTSALNSPPIIPTTSLTASSGKSDSTLLSVVPKLTLKLGSSQSPIPFSVKVDEDNHTKPPKREPSPELARFSPLVTRPPKQKITQTEHPKTLSTLPSAECKTNVNVKSSDNPLNVAIQPVIPPPIPWLPGGTLTASSVLLPQQLIPSSSSKPKAELLAQQATSKTDNVIPSTQRSLTAGQSSMQNPLPLIAETNRPSSYVDAEGNTVWICPACGKVDDGSPMIGCDGCDAWYHWECVGIAVAPNDKEDWFCRVCITRKKGFHSTGDGSDKKRKRNKKK